MGVDTKKLDFKCQIKPTKFNEFDFDDDDDDVSDDDTDDDFDDDEPVDYVAQSSVSDDEIEEDCTLSNITGEVEMRDYSRTGITLNENDRFAIVADGSGNEQVVWKIWNCQFTVARQM